MRAGRPSRIPVFLTLYATLAAMIAGCTLGGGGGGSGGASTSTDPGGSASTGGSTTSGLTTSGGAGGSAGSTTTGGTAGSGGAPECATAVDCPAPGDPCRVAQCDAGTCAEGFTAAGTPLPTQTSGDCLLFVCDGAGVAIGVADDLDVLDDGDACTLDACQSGTPSNTPLTAGAACDQAGGKLCDGAGACVACLQNPDCAAPKVCSPAHACVAPSCADGMKDGTETDVDCGGSCGATCTLGLTCATGLDCVSGVCSGLKCASPACDDGVKNGGESDVDCGGPCLTKCPAGKTCSNNADCLGGLCSGAVCLPTCVDGAKNGAETGIDCGGPQCPSCAMGVPCATAADCATGNCVDGVCCDTACSGTCVACTTSLKGVGANGVCGPILANHDPQNECALGVSTFCSSSPDGMCDGAGACTKWPVGTSCAPAGCSGNTAVGASTCDAASACTPASSTPCSPYLCSNGACTVSCVNNGQCAPGSGCVNGSCVLKKAAGAPCVSSVECLSNVCADGVCCATLCDGVCTSCNLPGSVGTCATLPSGASDADTCPSPHVCDGSGGCPGYLPVGKTCNTAAGVPSNQCNGMYCTDGRCCDTQCVAACRSCNVPGHEGTCAPLVNATDMWPINSFLGCGFPNACPNACDTCGPNATCIHENGFLCGADDQCQSGNCATSYCCNQPCEGPCENCASPFPGQCQQLADYSKGLCPGNTYCFSGQCKVPLGSACQSDAECNSGHCVDGVCCFSACAGLCQSCQAGSGSCNFILTGLDPSDECPGAQTCNGAGACQ